MDFLASLGIEQLNSGSSTGNWWDPDSAGSLFHVVSPVDGRTIASVSETSTGTYAKVVAATRTAFDF